MALVKEEFDKAYLYKKSLLMPEKDELDSSEEEEDLTEVKLKKKDLNEKSGLMSIKELFKRLHSFFKICLRRVRAFNFDSQLLY